MSRIIIGVAFATALIGCKKSPVTAAEPLQIRAHITVSDTKSEWVGPVASLQVVDAEGHDVADAKLKLDGIDLPRDPISKMFDSMSTAIPNARAGATLTLTATGAGKS